MSFERHESSSVNPQLRDAVRSEKDTKYEVHGRRHLLREIIQKCEEQVHRINTLASSGNLAPARQQEQLVFSSFVPDSTPTIRHNLLCDIKKVAQCSDPSVKKFNGREAEIQLLTEQEDEEEIARNLFSSLASSSSSSSRVHNGDQVLSLDAVREAARMCQSVGERALLEALYQALATHISSRGTNGKIEGVSIAEFSEAFATIPRVRGERVRWAGTLGLDQALARLLPRGDAFDGLRGMRELDGERLEACVQDVSARLAAALPGLIRKGLQRLHATAAISQVSTEHVNMKFIADMEVARFEKLDIFYKGAEELFGVPNPRIFEAMRGEHCSRSNAEQRFVSPNYNVETWPSQEWELVVCPVEGKPYPHAPRDKKRWVPGNKWRGNFGRDVVSIETLMADHKVKAKVDRAGLLREEVIGLRLYSGPIFVLYNAAMRGAPKRDVAYLKDNRYETTIFTITSGITKLSKVTDLPKGRLLYRGLGGDLMLPAPFWRNFSEYRVVLTVRTSRSVAALAAASALREKMKMDHPDDFQCRVLGRRNLLVLPAAVGAASSCANDDSSVRVQVLTDPRAHGDCIRLELALPTMSEGSAPWSLDQLVEAIREFCTTAIQQESTKVDVSVDEVHPISENFKGGVELGMLSLTASRETAMNYSRSVDGKRGTVFELHVGRVDVGASLEFLSQYPGEQEYLMPPLSCLEVIGDPRLETCNDADVVVIPLRVNVNLKSLTVEDLIGRRKRLHAATARNLQEELSLGAKERVEKLDKLLQERKRGQAEHLVTTKQRAEADRPALLGTEVHFSGQRWSAVWAPYLMCSEGRFFFEVKVIKAVGQLAVGFTGTRCGDQFNGEIGDDSISWGVFSFDKFRHEDEARALPKNCCGWFVSGSVLGLAIDFSKRQLLAKIIRPDVEEESCKDSGWNIVADGVEPGENVGGALVPVIAGGWGAVVTYNFGHTTMRNCISTYTPLSVAANTVHSNDSASTDKPAAEVLDRLDIGLSTLLPGFNAVQARHEALKPEEYNNDVLYKDLLNELIDTKTCLEKKQQILVDLLIAGAVPEQLKVVISAPLAHFRCQRSLEAECPGYSWRLIFSGWFNHLDEVCVPLGCAPCLNALLWSVLFDSAQKSASQEDRCMLANVGGNTGRQVKISDLTPTLHVKNIDLHSQRFEHAILGLIIVLTSESFAKSQNGALTNLDLRGLEYSEEIKSDIARAVVDGKQMGYIDKVNGLVVEQPKEGQNLRLCIERPSANLTLKAQVKEKLLADGERKRRELGSYLDSVDWSFVAGQAACNQWSTIDLSQNSLQASGSTGLSISLGTVTSLTVLNLAYNSLMPAGATAISRALTTLVGLKWLNLRCNRIGADGSPALARSLCELTQLRGVGLSDNQLNCAGAVNICDAVSSLSSLHHLDLSMNGIGSTGGNSVLALVQKSSNLCILGLKGQNLGEAVWPILEILGPSTSILKIFFGSLILVPAMNHKLTLGQVVDCCRPPVEISFADNPTGYFETTMSLEKWLDNIKSVHLVKVLSASLSGALLTVLELDHNHIGTDGIKALVPVLFQLATLHRLGLSFNEMGLSGAHTISEGLSKLTGLSSLSLEGNGFGCAGWLKLEPALDSLPLLTSLNSLEDYCTLRNGGTSEINISNKELLAAVSNLLPRNCSNLTNLDARMNDLVPHNSDKENLALFEDSLHTTISRIGFLYMLTSLNLSDNVLGEAGSAALKLALTSLSHLFKLDISRTELEQKGAREVSHGLGQLTALEDLHIAGNRIGAEGAFAVCTAFANSAALTSLDVGNNALGPDGAEVLSNHLHMLSRLVRLESPQNGFGPSGGELLAQNLSSLLQLTMLDLSSNQFGMGVKAVCEALAKVAVKAPALLRTLNLSHNDFGENVEDFISVITALPQLSALQTLIMDGNGLHDRGGEAVISALSFHSALQTLHLGENKLECRGGIGISKYLMGLTTLTSLHLESNSLEFFGTSAVFQVLPHLILLNTLDFCDNDVGEKGGEAIGRILPLITSLTTLNLEGNKLGSHGGLHVAGGVKGLSCLVSLDLRDNEIGPDGCSKVANLLSHMHQLHLDLRCNDLERRGRGKQPASSFSRLLPGVQTTKRKLSIATAPHMRIRGWLKKLNKVNEGDMLDEANWRDRLCFISNDKMFYKSAKKKGEDEEVADLSKIQSVRTAQHGAKQGYHIFLVDVQDKRKMVFSANSLNERAQWIAILTSKITKQTV